MKNTEKKVLHVPKLYESLFTQKQKSLWPFYFPEMKVKLLFLHGKYIDT